jgi:hypothetical protein
MVREQRERERAVFHFRFNEEYLSKLSRQKDNKILLSYIENCCHALEGHSYFHPIAVLESPKALLSSHKVFS